MTYTPDKTVVRWFLAKLFEFCREGYICITYPTQSASNRTDNPVQGKKKLGMKPEFFSHDNFEGAAVYSAEVAKTRNVYVSMCTLRERPTRGSRGTESMALCLPALHADIDIGTEGHAGEAGKYLPDVDAALAVLGRMPYAPSILVHTGGGFHAHWLLDEPIYIKDEDDQNQAKQVLVAWQGLLRSYVQQMGCTIDNTAELARVMRVAGSLNCKTENIRPVRVVGFPSGQEVTSVDDFKVVRYALSDIKEALLAAQRRMAGEDRPSSLKGYAHSQDYSSIKNGDARVIIERCAFARYCQEHQQTLSEPEWHAIINNIVHAQRGAEVAHEISCQHPTYSKKETDAKIDHALQSGAPHTCEYIQNELSFTGCPLGGCGFKSPIGWASSRVGQALAALEHIEERARAESAAVFENPVLHHLAVLKRERESAYLAILEKIKSSSKVSIRKLEAAVKDTLRRMPGADMDEEKVPFPIDYEYEIPEGWTVSAQGVYKVSDRGRDKACLTPVTIARRLIDQASGAEKVELVFQRDGEWKTVIAERDQVMSRSNAVSLSKYGLPVSSETAKHFVDYMMQYETLNISRIPKAVASQVFGWLSGTEFLPGLSPAVMTNVSPRLEAAFQPRGTLAEWRQVVLPLRDKPLSRFVLTASLAAPLLSRFGLRNILVHLYGTSQSGKTACLVAAASAWGLYDSYMASFHTTKVGLEQFCSQLQHLPMLLNEMQHAADQQGWLDKLVYMLGEGSGKVRGTVTGAARPVQTWNTIFLSTGEHPISSEASAEGVMSRVIEFYVPNLIEDKDYASRLYTAGKNHYGHAGTEMIRAYLAQDHEEMACAIDHITEVLKAKASAVKDSHLKFIAFVTAVDGLASTAVFGKEEPEASWAMAYSIVDMLERDARKDEVTRAMEYTMSWVAQHERYFNNDCTERYGWEGNGLYVLPTVFKDMLQRGGFNLDRVKRGFFERGWLDAVKDQRGKIE